MIRLDRVSKCFSTTQVIHQVSLQLSTGSSLAILGPSGSGKTTLLRLIAGLEMPDEGAIWLNGVLASRPGWVLAPHARQVGFLFQTTALWPHMTVAQNILFGLARLSRANRSQRLHEVLSLTQLSDLADRYPHQLSGGEARRAGLARTLAPRPAIMLLDEPLTNLDSALKDTLSTAIRNHVSQTHACLVYVTHDATEVTQLTERSLYLRNRSLCECNGPTCHLD